MNTVDSHFHLWDLSHGKHAWLQIPDSDINSDTPELIRLGELRKSYLVGDYLSETADQDIVKGVHVEGRYDERNPVAETAWLQALADQPASHGFPHAIIAYLDLADCNCSRTIDEHAQFANFRGVRQILNIPIGPEHHEYLLDQKWAKNFSMLRRYDASFDLQVYFPQMAAAAKIARRYPDTSIVLNHAGMPSAVCGEEFSAWRAAITRLAECDNVSVKICGLGMTLPSVTNKVAGTIVTEVINIFGVDRVMFGSNFPVDRLFSSYAQLWTMYRYITAPLSSDERVKLFHDNAARIYRL